MFGLKNGKITKWSPANKGYASTYNVEILNSFYPEVQLRDTEFAIKNKLIDLLAELRRLKFLMTLVVELKIINKI